MNDLYNELQHKIKQLDTEVDDLQRNCDVFNEQMNDAVERATELQIENEKLKKENERLKQYKEDNFLYDFEELQDKVLKLQKDNQELKRIVESYKDKEDKLREYCNEQGKDMTKLESIFTGEETKEYVLLNGFLQILNEGDEINEI